jgi:integrase/recombinase XerD
MASNPYSSEHMDRTERKPGRRQKAFHEQEQMIFPPESLRSFAQKHYEWMLVRNYSPLTVHTRHNYLAIFFAWCEERDVRDLHQITTGLIERYQKHLYHFRKKNGAPLSFGSQSQHLVHIREFFRWCARKHFLLYNPAGELELPKKERRIPQNILTQNEVESVIQKVDLSTPNGLRDRTILETLYSTGMRRMELLKLGLYDVDRVRGTVSIRQGKGKKDRFIPIGSRALFWINKYLSEARPGIVTEPDPGNLFLSDEGAPLTVDYLSETVKEHLVKGGVTKKGSCHLFRHAMATLLLENGASLRHIQEMLGHAQLSTTEIYTFVSIEKLKEIHTALHPGANLQPRHESGEADLKAEQKEEDEPS